MVARLVGNRSDQVDPTLLKGQEPGSAVSEHGELNTFELGLGAVVAVVAGESEALTWSVAGQGVRTGAHHGVSPVHEVGVPDGKVGEVRPHEPVGLCQSDDRGVLVFGLEPLDIVDEIGDPFAARSQIEQVVERRHNMVGGEGVTVVERDSRADLDLPREAVSADDGFAVGEKRNRSQVLVVGVQRLHHRFSRPLNQF